MASGGGHTGYGSQGFSILLWVDNLPPESAQCTTGNNDTCPTSEEREEALLSDACCLLGVRWGMQMGIHHHNGNLWAYGCNNKFNVSDATLSNALGGLNLYVHFLKGGIEHSLAELARFQECKMRWGVPAVVTASDGGYGKDREEHPFFKKKRI